MALSYTPYEALRPLVTGWLGKMELARRHRQGWASAAKECMAFYSEPTGFMWDQKFEGKFWSHTMKAPRFQITLAKAFELVAIFGPTLWNNVPHRTVKPKRALDLPPELFGNMQQNPQAQQMFQMYQQQSQQKQAVDTTTAKLMEMWLNYTPIEQPGGGLESHGEMAVTEALIKGRSCLWPRPYQMPGSQRTLTGCFWKSVDDLFIDPDAQTLDEAQWIALRWVQPYWVVEERFALPKNSLKDSATLESSHSVGSSYEDPLAPAKRASGESADMVEYYEIFSKAGPGARISGVETSVSDHLEQVVGKNAYIVVSPNVPFPLNAPTEKLRGAGKNKASGDVEVAAMFSWPIPTWSDSRWPVAILDFYNKPNSLWPIPPLAPGLGELKFLNVFVSHLANRIWTSSRDFIAIDKRMYDELAEAFENGDDMTLLPINQMTNGKISDNVAFLQQPQVNMDAWRIIEAVSDMFDRRVGLTDLLYGMNPGGTNPRTAEEVSAKRAAVQVRPEYMAKKVEHWSSQAMALEAFCTRFFVTGRDVAPLVGEFGKTAWENYIMSTDVEAVVREMQYSVAAGSARRPNKDRDVANMSQFINQFGAVLVQHAQQSGDTGPINAMFKLWGEASDMDTSELQLRPPQQGGPQDQMAQQQMAMMQQQMKMQQDQMRMKQRVEQMKLDADQQKHQQELTQDEQQHRQEMSQDVEQHRLQMQMKGGVNRIKQLEAMQKAEQQGQAMRFKAAEAAQKIRLHEQAASAATNGSS